MHDQAAALVTLLAIVVRDCHTMDDGEKAAG
jgi:hypothetical protein